MSSPRQPSLRERALPLLELTRYNPPALRALTYRGAPYRTSLARMLARLPKQTLGTGPDAEPPLASINTGDGQDWTIALLHAWAVVMDVLSFYQERFTNEGYLATAVEERSVLELARAIGYELRPGVSAGTDLAFTVVKRPDQPHQIARLPAGLAVQSVAIPGLLSQVFETSQPLEARSEWNALWPARYDDVRWRQDIRQDATSLRLAGVQTGLAPGDTLIVVSRPWLFRIQNVTADPSGTRVRWVDETGAERSVELPTSYPDLQVGDAVLLVQEPARLGPSRPSLVVTLKTVNVVPNSGTTLISYQHPTYGVLLQQVAGSQTGLQSGDRLLLVDRHFMTKLDPEKDLADLDNENLTDIIRAAFDENQLELPLAAKLVIKTRGASWAIQDAKGQPLYEIRLIDDKFVIYEDQAWLVASVKAVKNEPNLDRTTLELEHDPAVERGSRPIRNPGVFALRQKAALFGYTATGFFMNQEEPAVWRPQGIGLPDGVIRACVRHPQGELFVITEQGLFRSSDEAASWQPLTLGLARKDIYALALTGGDHLLAGADDGSIYLSKDKGDNWAALSGETLEPPRRGLKKLWPKRFASANLPKTVVRALVTYRDWRHAYIAAGTDVGVFRSSDRGRSWRPINRDLPDQDAKTGLTDTVVYALTAVQGKSLYAATSAGVFQIRNRARHVWGTAVAVIGGAVLGGVLYWLWALAGPYVGQPGLIGRLLTWYVQLFNSIITAPKLAWIVPTRIVPLVALAGLSLIAARHFLVRYLSILAQIDVPTFALQTTPDGASMFAGTEKGVFQTEPRKKKWYQRLLAPGRPWRPINQTASAPLFMLDLDPETDLDQGILTDKIRAEFTRHQHELPDQAQLIVKTKGQAWAVRDASGRTLYQIRLVDKHLLVYGGLIQPRAILPLALQPDLDRGRLSNELQAALEGRQIELPPGTRLFIATPGQHWQLLNTRDVPLVEIRRVDSAKTPATPGVLVLFEVQKIQALGLKRQDAASAPLFMLDLDLATDLDQGILTKKIRAEFTRHQHELPDQAQLIVKSKGQAWAVQDASRQTVYEIELINDHLVVYGGLIRPCAILPSELKPGLDRGRLSNELQKALEERLSALPPGTRLFIAKPGEHWQLLNAMDAPLYEIRRVAGVLVLVKVRHDDASGAGDLLLAGTQAGQLYRLRLADDGAQWQRFDAGMALSLSDVQSIAVVGNTQYVTGQPAPGKIETRWTSEQLAHKWVDLDLVYPAIQPESWLVIRQAGPGGSRLYRVQNAQVISSADLLNAGQFTRLEVDRAADLDQFDRQLSQVWTNSQPLAFFDDRPLQGPEIVLDRHVPGLETGKRLIARGKPMRARIITTRPGSYLSSVGLQYADELDAGQVPAELSDQLRGHDRAFTPLARVEVEQAGSKWMIVDAGHTDQKYLIRRENLRLNVYTEGLKLKSLKNLETVDLHAGESLQVLSLEDTGTPGEKRWRLRNANRFEGEVVASYGQIVFEPAKDDDAALNEVVIIKGVKDSADQTILTLEQPLGTVYDRTTLSLLGNVVPATHGATVAHEVLGSSDGRQANQRFRLRQSPLTYLPAAGASGSHSTLEVRVNGVEWQAEPSLNPLKPNDRAYLVRQDERSQSVIIFGDGQQGARLPTSDEEITASYRIGTGPEGNVPAESLTQPQTRIENLQSVTNPLPAAGGTAREHRDRARSRAPLSLRSSQRIVSLSDYQDFARTFAGIGKARADMVWAGNRQWLHITVADRQGNPVLPGSDLFQSLAEAIQAQRALPNPPVHIQSFEAVYFNVEAKLWIDPEHQARKQAIQSAVEQALASTYSFEQREFGQPVAATEVMACMQSACTQSAHAGILGLELSHFALDAEQKRPIVQDKLESKSARWEDGRLHPAQLLLVNAGSEDGILLNLEMAT